MDIRSTQDSRYLYSASVYHAIVNAHKRKRIFSTIYSINFLTVCGTLEIFIRCMDTHQTNIFGCIFTGCNFFFACRFGGGDGGGAAVVVFNFYAFNFYLFRLCSKYKKHININAETNVYPSKWKDSLV